MKTRTMNDGYAYLVINHAQAIALFNCGTDIYKLYDDGSESLCESDDDIKEAEHELGVGLGFIDDMTPTCPMCGAQLYKDSGKWWCSEHCGAVNYGWAKDELETYYEQECD